MKKIFCIMLTALLLTASANSTLPEKSGTDFTESLYCDLDLPFCYGVV